MKKKTTLRALLSGCALISSTFAIAQPCTPPTGVSASPVSVCLGNPITLSATIPSTTTTINWYTVSTGGTAIATTTSASTTYTPTAAGTYTFYAESAAGSSGGPGTPQNYSFTGAVQSVTLPAGTYTLECWGANGGGSQGGKGGYATGTLTLSSATTLYVVVGGPGGTGGIPADINGGYNGGGPRPIPGGATRGSGGGATHIATATGLLSTLSGNQLAVKIVAGGAGGGSNAGAGFGYGGGLSGQNSNGANPGLGGTQTAGGAAGAGTSGLPGTFGQGGQSNEFAGAGGGGWYGGGAGGGTATTGNTSNGGGGGSGYIGGVTSGTTALNGQTGFVTNPDATGNGYARITPISSGCVSTRVATAVVTVYALPTVAITPATADICSGSSIGLTASGATSYSWSPATGLSATVGNAVTASPTATTTYTVTGTANSCSATATRTVTVSPAPVAGTLAGTQTVCAGSTTTFSVSGNSATGTWSSGSTGVATVSSTGVVTGVLAGTDTITYTVLGTGACSNATTTRTVTVTAAPVAGTLAGTQTVCTGGTTTFSVSGNSATGTWSSGSTGVATISSSGVVTGVLAGTDTITYTVTGTGGCSNSIATRTVTVVPVPVATITPATNATFCQGGSLTFTGPAPATGITYQWQRNGVDVTGATNNTFSATSAGNYRLVLSNGVCADTSAAVSVTVNPTPGAAATTSGALAFCQGGSVLLTSSSSLSSGATYQWLRNGFNVGGATNPTYSATTTGNYTVKITNTATGCADTSSPAIVVTVSTPPSTSITQLGTSPICQGSTIRFTSNNPTSYTYQWYNGATPIVGATTNIYTANAAGSYYVVIVNGTCTATTTPRTVVVNPLPTVAIVANGPTAFCNGGSVILDGGTTTGLTYQWRRNAVNIAGATSATYTATQTGIYTLQVTNVNGCQAISNGITVTVSTQPVPVITSSGATTFCQGNSITLQATTGAGYTYQWLLAGNPISGATSDTYGASASGNYTVVITNGTCVATSAPFAVNVLPAPPAVITPAGPTAFCQGGSVTLNANRAAGLTYQWTHNTVDIPGATGYQYTAASTGNYTVKISDGTCPATAAAISVTVNDFPIAVITVTGGVNLSTDPFSSYQWYRNGVLIPGATSQTYTAVRDGFYAVVVSDALGCSATSSIAVVNALDVNGVNGNIAVKVYPNPTNGMVMVDADFVTDLSVMSIDGRELMSAKAAKSIDISAMPQGLYLIRITNHSTGQMISLQKINKK